MRRIASVARALHTDFRTVPEEVNLDVGVVQRRRRFTPLTLAASFILAFLRNPVANDQDVADVASSLGVEVSPQAVDQRFNDSLTAFFRGIFERIACQVIQGGEALAPLLDRFSEVCLLDSTGFALPPTMAKSFPGCGGSGHSEGNQSAIKLQTEFDLRSGALCCVQAEAGRCPDQGTDRQSISPKPGGLRIADLGYFSVAVLRQLTSAGAHFISRVQFQTRVEFKGVWIPIIDYLTSQAKSNAGVVDQQIKMGRDEQFSCRLIAWRVPPEIAARRRKKLRATYRKRGNKPSRRALLTCDWNFLVTDLDGEQLSRNEAIVLYRSRWQIELLFKRWKSYCRIDLMDGRTDERSMTRFWIRMCAATLQHYMVVACCWQNNEVPSFAKVALKLRDHVEELCTALTSRRSLERLLEKIQRKARTSCRRTKRKKPAWIELIRNPELLEYRLT